MPDEEPVHVYVIGTAGSGKSRFTAAFGRWMKEHGQEIVALNLDPGAEALPYAPDVDIREWIQLAEVMDRYQLGPNGAQVMAADLLALRLGDVKEQLSEYRAPYVLADTPGQTELFVFRESGRVTVELLAPGRSCILFLLDPFLARKPSAFVSLLLLGATTQFRFGIPMLYVIPKRDLLKPEELERLAGWTSDSARLEDDLANEKADMVNQMSSDAFRVLDGMGGLSAGVPVSSETLEGMEDVYAWIQEVFAGGEDLVESASLSAGDDS
ncbi:MAG: GPN-loop GTPase [Thermoplasmata archaeon]|jgi:GTPase SAR1 family protein|nr:GPN-loop GTPase [Thermoplasmata archaeon]